MGDCGLDTEKLLMELSKLRSDNQRLRLREQERAKVGHGRGTVDKRFHRMAELNADALLVVSQDGRILFANPAASDLFGVLREELTGLFFGEPVGADQLAEIEILSAKGPQKPAEMRSAEVEWEGRPAFLASIRDITKRKKNEAERARLEARLGKARKMEALGTLAGGLAHDFNNLLAGIMGNSELALLDLPENHPVHGRVTQVIEISQRARDLVKQILVFAGHDLEEPRHFDLAAQVRGILSVLKMSCPQNVETEEAIEAEGFISGVPGQIDQVVLHLCQNSFHAMKSGPGKLTVRLSPLKLDAPKVCDTGLIRPGSYLVLDVRDTGPGIDPAVAERMFDPYVTTKVGADGTGLGLAVVQSIVIRHHGHIKVDSSNRGTMFRVFFPRAGAPRRSEKEDAEPIPRGSEQILLVDDEFTVLDIARSMLESLGYTVVTVRNGMEAFERFLARPREFDLVITDQSMPQMTGTQLAKEILSRRSDLPIILCTGHADSLVYPETIGLGIEECLFKPFSIRQLGEAVRRVLRRKGTRAAPPS